MPETEIRFAVPESVNSDVCEAYFAAGDGGSEVYRTVYFDTPDGSMWAHGIECRIRKSGDKRTQTVKRRSAAGPAFLREESEVTVEGDTPNLEHLQSLLPRKLARLAGSARIEPVFETEVWRRKRVFLEEGGNAVEAVYDLGTVRAGNKSMPIDEVEHELLEGDARYLTRQCLDFLDRVPCGLLTEGKAARGFALATGEMPQPVTAPKVRIAPDMNVPEAIAAALHAAFAQVMANHAALVRTGHPESIHQMRVGLRRLRSTISAFDSVLDLSDARDLVRETNEMFARLGDIRDADVFLSETSQIIPTASLGARASEILAREVGRFRDRACEDMVAYASGPAFARLTVRWYGWIESAAWLRDSAPVDRLLARRPVADFAITRMAKLEDKLMKRGRHALTGSVDDWHRARIAAKKMRYVGEPLSRVLSEHGGKNDRPEQVKSLARLQDELGHFNDLCNVAPFLARVGDQVPKRSRAAFREAAAFCAGWSSAEVAHSVHLLEKRWKRFDRGGDRAPT